MDSIKLSEAKAHLGYYAREAASGKRIVITDRNKAMAVLSGMDAEGSGVRPRVGLMNGQAHIPDDFDAPLEEFEKDFYGS